MKTETKQTMKMNQVMAMWKRESKQGKPYFSGKLADGTNLVGFYNTFKKNPQEPDVRIYKAGELGHNGEAVMTLWANVSKKGTKYLSGTYEGKRVIGFINGDDASNKPYFAVYSRDED